MTDRPNVVLVTIDSLRADHCGFMGYERNTTPTLDGLAERGVAFENAIASGVPTVASVTAVMTGDYSFASPEVGEVDAQREQVTARRSLAEALADAGYATGALSPNPPASSYFGFDAGFDWFEDFLGGEGALGRAWNRVFRRSIRGGRAATYLRLARNVLRREEVVRPWEAHYDRIRRWRERVAEPYFLWVLLLEPHHPWLPPASARRWSTRTDALRSFAQFYRMLDSGWTPAFTPRQRRRLVDLYDDGVRHGDAFLDRLLGDLADDDPVVVVHADHGEEFGERGRYGHQPHLSEPLVHVPLVVAGAGRRGRVRRPVELRSVAPTVARLAGADAAFAAPGLFADRDRHWAVSTVLAGGERRVAVRTRSRKYVAAGGSERLVDLRTDPPESVDPAYEDPAVAAAFRAARRHHVAAAADREAIRAAAADVAAEGIA